MQRLLYLGFRSFAITSSLAACHASRRLDPLEALALLRRLAASPENLATLRRAAADLIPATFSPQLDDHAVLEQLAARIAAGYLAVVDGPAALPLSGLDGAPTEEAEPPSAPPAKPPPPRTWIEVQLIGEDDQPIPGVRYRIELPDGSVREGRLNASGLARVDAIDPGLCDVTFPDIDQDAWARA